MAGENDRYVVTGKDCGPDLDKTADDPPQIDGSSLPVDQIGGRLIEPACRRDQAIQAVERLLKDADRALGALVVLRQGTPKRLDRLTDDRDRRLKGMGIVFSRTPDFGGGAMQGVDHSVELDRYIGKFRQVVAVGERSSIGSSLANMAGAAREPAQATAHAQQGCKRDGRHHQINHTRDDDWWRRPIRLTEMGARESVLGKRGYDRPATSRRRKRGHRGDDLGTSGRAMVNQ